MGQATLYSHLASMGLSATACRTYRGSAVVANAAKSSSGSSVLLVESPSKATKIQQFLGDQYRVRYWIITAIVCAMHVSYELSYVACRMDLKCYDHMDDLLLRQDGCMAWRACLHDRHVMASLPLICLSDGAATSETV